MFSNSTEAVAAPGERFEPADLLALSGAHADVGDWAKCLNVLETVKEVSRVARTAGTAKGNELLLAKGACVRSHHSGQNYVQRQKIGPERGLQ